MVVQDVRRIHRTITVVDGNRIMDTQMDTFRRVTLTRRDLIDLPDEMRERYGHEDRFYPLSVSIPYDWVTRWDRASRSDVCGWHVGWVRVTGPNIKRDGTHGKREVQIKFWDGDASMPDWLAALVQLYHPARLANPFSAPVESEVLGEIDAALET